MFHTDIEEIVFNNSVCYSWYYMFYRNMLKRLPCLQCSSFVYSFILVRDPDCVLVNSIHLRDIKVVLMKTFILPCQLLIFLKGQTFMVLGYQSRRK